GVVAGAEQHGLRAQLDSLLARGEHALAHRSRLRAVIARERQLWRLTSLTVGPQLLRVAGAVLCGERVGDCEDRARRAIVALQRDRMSVWEVVREVEDVARAGGAKAVDRLKVIADHGQFAPLAAQAAHDVRCTTGSSRPAPAGAAPAR